MNQKDVSLAHLKAVLAVGPIVSTEKSTHCFYCGGGVVCQPDKPTDILHATNCVYIAAKDHVGHINELARSEAAKNERPSPPRYRDQED